MHLPLRAWFGAIFLAATSSQCVSAMLLSRQLGDGHKTAWFLARRLRTMIKQEREWFSGIVDETSVGGKAPKQANGQPA